MIRKRIASRLRRAANKLDPPPKATYGLTPLYHASTSSSNGTLYAMHPRRDKP